MACEMTVVVAVGITVVSGKVVNVEVTVGLLLKVNEIRYTFDRSDARGDRFDQGRSWGKRTTDIINESGC